MGLGGVGFGGVFGGVFGDLGLGVRGSNVSSFGFWAFGAWGSRFRMVCGLGCCLPCPHRLAMLRVAELRGCILGLKGLGFRV